MDWLFDQLYNKLVENKFFSLWGQGGQGHHGLVESPRKTSNSDKHVKKIPQKTGQKSFWEELLLFFVWSCALSHLSDYQKLATNSKK